jgi:hypothetical protein
MGNDVKVCTLPDSYSYSNDDGGVGYRQTPVKYSPGSRLDSFDDWKFLFDDIRPDWWTNDMTESAERQLIAAFRSRWDGKHYKGSLDLRGTGITALPDGLTVSGWLDLSGTGITALPDGLTVGGCLDLEGTSITTLPDNLTVGGWLDLRGTGITALPDDLTVGNSLEGTSISVLLDDLPDELPVAGVFHPSDFDVLIEELPLRAVRTGANSVTHFPSRRHLHSQLEQTK